MELWFTERQTPSVAFSCRVVRTLDVRRTVYQDLAVLETEPFGRMLVLDGAIQLTLADEFIYHEMLAHVPLFAHGRPRRVLVVGGGDGGTVREVLRHPEVEEVVLAEIDPEVVEACRRHFPELASSIDDPRVRLCLGDGIAHVAEHPGEYDVILVDSTDPVGPAVGLFSESFYAGCRRALRPGGLMAAQTESPVFHADLIARAFSRMRAVFPVTRLYLAPVPTYPGGLWSFTIGSTGPDPADPWGGHQPRGREDEGTTGPRGGFLATRYYTPEVHRAAFALPAFVQQILSAAPQPEAVAT